MWPFSMVSSSAASSRCWTRVAGLLPLLFPWPACLGTDASSIRMVTARRGLIGGTSMSSVLALGAEKIEKYQHNHLSALNRVHSI